MSTAITGVMIAIVLAGLVLVIAAGVVTVLLLRRILFRDVPKHPISDERAASLGPARPLDPGEREALRRALPERPE
ncbi:hypothetical protein [Janibacter sp. GXQ6167]|uniref:hypothetical protein n=1 Tax=Janibacter sp. GXQ6167 TaxID=3240791 RepID=UPI0035269226